MLTPGDPGDAVREEAEALVAATLDVERHVGREGWDQAPRLFALVPTAALLAAEPGLAAALAADRSAGPPPPGALTAVEQDDFAATEAVVDQLERIWWPSGVVGCAVALERTVLPAAAEAELGPTGAAGLTEAELAEAVARHPARVDVRLVVGVHRGGHTHGVARLRDRPEHLVGASDLVPGLASALAHTLAGEEPG